MRTLPWRTLCRLGVDDVCKAHWAEYGRNYYARYDYEGVDKGAAEKMMALSLPSPESTNGTWLEIQARHHIIVRGVRSSAPLIAESWLGGHICDSRSFLRGTKLTLFK